MYIVYIISIFVFVVLHGREVLGNDTVEIEVFFVCIRKARCYIIYKIPCRRARARPSGCLAFRPSACASKGSHTTTRCYRRYLREYK